MPPMPVTRARRVRATMLREGSRPDIRQWLKRTRLRVSGSRKVLRWIEQYRGEARTRGRPTSRHRDDPRECPWRETDARRRKRGRKVRVESERGAHPPGVRTI